MGGERVEGGHKHTCLHGCHDNSPFEENAGCSIKTCGDGGSCSACSSAWVVVRGDAVAEVTGEEVAVAACIQRVRCF